MKGRLIALDHVNGVETAALMVDGKLQDLLVSDARVLALGTIIRARVDRPLKGQGGVMVTWPARGDAPAGTGFLRRAKGLATGEDVLVQISGYAEAGKAQPVTDRVLFKSRHAIVTPGAPGINVSRSIKDDDRRDALKLLVLESVDEIPHGLILRSSAAQAQDDDISADILDTLALAEDVLSMDGQGVLMPGDSAHRLAWREWTDPAQVDTAPGSFEDHGILDALEDLDSPLVDLGAGHHMAVEPTRALVAVDVNTGRDTSPAAALKANLAALADLPRQLRLRGLGGQITVDLAPVLKRDRRQIETAARAACRACAVETEVIGWTPLGHLELKRKRERRPLSEVLG
ncbi:MAG: ribonuclease E/G [Pseudomonadota bacterium]